MSFFSDPIGSVKHTLRDPVGAVKNAWNSGGREVAIGGLLGGPMGAAIGGTYATVKNSLPGPWSPNAGDNNQRWETELSRSMSPTLSNPMVNQWGNVARSISQGSTAAGRGLLARYGNTVTGGDPGGYAASRARSAGLLGLANLAQPAWSRWKNLELRTRDQAGDIGTDTDVNAFLRGFVGGGGSNALGTVGSYLGGG